MRRVINVVAALALVTSAVLVAAPVAGAAQVERSERCVPTADASKSVARLWDEVLLDAIRRDIPRPTVHARNLYHLSAAMWDAWAAYDPVADGVFVERKLSADDPSAARDRAISYAAYRILRHRYGQAVGAEDSLAEFDALMGSLCYPTDRKLTDGDSPTALGNSIAAEVIRLGMHDGSRERQGYAPKDYEPVNDPLIVELPGTTMNDPNRWQPLALEVSYTQNGVPLPVGPQKVVTPHWGDVTSFALPPSAEPGLPIDPGTPPLLGRSGRRRGVQGRRHRRHPPQCHARPAGRCRGGHLAGCPR